MNTNDRIISAIHKTNNNPDKLILSKFVDICDFLLENPNKISGKLNLNTDENIEKLFKKYSTAYLKKICPTEPRTIPDELVSLILKQTYNYTEEESLKIKIDHQRSMSAENCVGALLEKYICKKSESDGWIWCCGEIVKSTDFIKKSEYGWLQIQIKNRDNSENSSSSAIRQGTEIKKWFRTYSRTGKTNWENLPDFMKKYGMSESDFHQFCIQYLSENCCKKSFD